MHLITEMFEQPGVGASPAQGKVDSGLPEVVRCVGLEQLAAVVVHPIGGDIAQECQPWSDDGPMLRSVRTAQCERLREEAKSLRTYSSLDSKLMAHNVKQGLQGADARPLDRLGERIAARHVGDLIPGASPMSEEGPDLILTPSKAEILAGERGDQVDGCRLGASPVRVIVICGIAHRHRLPWMSRR